MDIILWVTVLTVAMALLFDFSNGFHDAANATSTVIATKSMKPRPAVAMSALFNFLPALVMGTAVANTISKIVKLDDLPAVAAGAVPTGIRVTLAALIGAIFWNFFTWAVGMPSSSSHALIGGLIGAGYSAGGTKMIAWDKVDQTVVAIFASPIIAALVAILAAWIVRGIQRWLRLHDNHEAFRWGQIASSAFVSWGHGSNDAQKTMGVIAATLYSGGYIAANAEGKFAPPQWAILAAGAAISIGTFYGGWRIIETMGMKIARITRASGIAANLGAIVSINGATHLGVPISTTHAAASSVIGSGIGSGHKINLLTVRNMVTAWVVTLPSAAVVGYISYRATVLPGQLAPYATGAVIVALLAWALRIMLHTTSHEDIKEKLREEFLEPGVRVAEADHLRALITESLPRVEKKKDKKKGKKKDKKKDKKDKKK